MAIDADDDRRALVDRPLGGVGGLVNLALNPSALDGRQRAARRVDLGDERARAFLDSVGLTLDGPGASDRVDRVGDAGFRRDDLLRPQREPRRLLGRQRQRFVAAVAVERLRATEHGGHRLNRDADDVVVRLLRRERAAGGLRVETQLHRAGPSHAEPVAHDVGPEPARRTELGDLLDEVVVRGEEERQPLADAIEVEARGPRGLDVGDSVGQRERDFLHRRRAGLADVVAADRDRVPARQLAVAPGQDVRRDPQGVRGG